MDGDHGSGDSNLPNSKRIELQKKRNMSLNRRAVASGGDSSKIGSGSSDHVKNGLYDPNESGNGKSRLLSKKKGTRTPGLRKTKKNSKHRNRGHGGSSSVTMFFVLGLVITGTVVMSYVFIGGSNTNDTWSLQQRSMEVSENGNVVSVHNQLRRKFDGAVTAAEEKLHHVAHLANQKFKHAAKIKSHAIHYDREQLQKDYEKETSHLPKFPKKYLGTKPPKDFDIQKDYKPLGGNRFEEYIGGEEPYHITKELILKSNELARSRRKYVKDAMKHAYSGYEKYAFGMDEVLPNTKKGDNNWGGMAITMVDALDTLWLMNMKDEFYRGRDWVRDKLNHDRVGSVSVFETTIRSLGGLLAAYDWSHDKAFLEKAYDLGKRLIKSFEGTNTGIPYGQVDLRGGHTSNIGWTGSNAILSEFGTLQVEFRYLAKAMHGAQSTDEFAQKTEHVFEILDKISPDNGLFPYFVQNNVGGGRKGRRRPKQNNPQIDDGVNSSDEDGTEKLPVFSNDHLTFGAMADSVYEYMLKVWLQGGQTEPLYRDMYDKAIQGMHDELLQTSSPSGLVYIADKQGSSIQHKMDHLVCFMGGLLALGAYTDPQGLQSDRAQRDLKTARSLTYTCYQMYARMSTGISPEFVQFTPNRKEIDFVIGSGAPHYLLRPEAVESFFILNFLTNDPVYREWGWEMFQSIEKYCKTEIGYGSLGNVDAAIEDNGYGEHQQQKPRNKMESFFLAETLKYLYLLQDPDTEVDILNKHVFNTEAHPTRIFPVFDEEE